MLLPFKEIALIVGNKDVCLLQLGCWSVTSQTCQDNERNLYKVYPPLQIKRHTGNSNRTEATIEGATVIFALLDFESS